MQFARRRSGAIGTCSPRQTGPVSRPFSIRMTMTAVSVSPAMIARWIGAAPRQRGSLEACRLKQPKRRFEHRRRQDEAVGDDDGDIGAQRGEGGLVGCVLKLTGVRT